MFGPALRTIFLFISVFTLTVFCLFLYIFTFSSPTIPKTIVNAQEVDISILEPTPVISNWYLIEGIVKEELSGTTGKYSVVIKNLSTDEEYLLNENQVYKTASLYKLWIMAEVYKQIEDGTLTKQMRIGDSVENLNARFNIATEAAEKKEGAITFTIDEALERMITYSDNYSALLLSSKVKLKSVSALLEDMELYDSIVGKNLPTSTAYDIALFYEKLYKNELGDVSSSSEMLDLLKRQQIKRKLPKYLPEGAVIAHKTGELDSVSHDGGIVYTPYGNYIIVVMSESTDPKAAEERIANISKRIYDYFMKDSDN